MTSTVLLTGASGYLGSSIALALRHAGIEVLTAGRHADDDIALDLLRPDEIAARRLPAHIDCCIHAAAANEVSCRADPVTATTANVTATRALLAAATRAGIGRFVYLSTFHVFGRPRGPIDETTPPQPVGDYALTHWMAEQFVRQWAARSGAAATVIRPANAYGEPARWSLFRRWTLAPFDFMRQAIHGDAIRLLSDGSPVRAYVSLDAIGSAVLAAARGDAPALVHSAGSPWTMTALANLVADVARGDSGRVVPVRLGPVASNEAPYRFGSRHLPLDADPAGTRMRAFLQSVACHLRPAAG